MTVPSDILRRRAIPGYASPENAIDRLLSGLGGLGGGVGRRVVKAVGPAAAAAAAIGVGEVPGDVSTRLPPPPLQIRETDLPTTDPNYPRYLQLRTAQERLRGELSAGVGPALAAILREDYDRLNSEIWTLVEQYRAKEEAPAATGGTAYERMFPSATPVPVGLPAIIAPEELDAGVIRTAGRTRAPKRVAGPTTAADPVVDVRDTDRAVEEAGRGVDADAAAAEAAAAGAVDAEERAKAEATAAEARARAEAAAEAARVDREVEAAGEAKPLDGGIGGLPIRGGRFPKFPKPKLPRTTLGRVVGGGAAVAGLATLLPVLTPDEDPTPIAGPPPAAGVTPVPEPVAEAGEEEALPLTDQQLAQQHQMDYMRGSNPVVDYEDMRSSIENLRPNRWENITRFGLALAAGQSPFFGQNVGNAGLVTLEARDQGYKDYQAAITQLETLRATNRNVDAQSDAARASVAGNIAGRAPPGDAAAARRAALLDTLLEQEFDTLRTQIQYGDGMTPEQIQEAVGNIITKNMTALGFPEEAIEAYLYEHSGDVAGGAPGAAAPAPPGAAAADIEIPAWVTEPTLPNPGPPIVRYPSLLTTTPEDVAAAEAGWLRREEAMDAWTGEMNRRIAESLRSVRIGGITWDQHKEMERALRQMYRVDTTPIVYRTPPATP